MGYSLLQKSGNYEAKTNNRVGLIACTIHGVTPHFAQGPLNTLQNHNTDIGGVVAILVI
ncbi:MAG: hypothetical protein RLZZ262_339 [Bacteroidota bacterium]|jgi:hypothetical protein